MENRQPIAIMICDLNPLNSQDRSVLEIAWQLNREFPLQIHSISLAGYDNWPDMEHIQYRTRFTKPILLQYMNYQFDSWRRLKRNPTHWIQSTGIDSLTSSIVHVHFVHHRWQKVVHSLPPDKILSPSLLKNSYRNLVNFYKKEMEKLIYKPDKKYIAVSHAVKKELMEHFAIPSENIEIIYHGVDSTQFYPCQKDAKAMQVRQQMRRDLGLSDNDFILLHAGDLNARKGLFKALEVLSFLKKNDFNNVKLLAIGEGDQDKLIEESQTLDIEDKLILIPHTKDIRRYYWASDCLFFPSYYEPFGMAILEAMACGLPVVASETAGGSELIIDGENGLLFNPWGSAHEMANSLLPLLRDPHLGLRLGQAARATAENYTWERTGNQFRQFYKKLAHQESQG